MDPILLLARIGSSNLYKEKKTAEEIAGIIGVGRSTVYRYLEAMGQKGIL